MSLSQTFFVPISFATQFSYSASHENLIILQWATIKTSSLFVSDTAILPAPKNYNSINLLTWVVDTCVSLCKCVCTYWLNCTFWSFLRPLILCNMFSTHRLKKFFCLIPYLLLLVNGIAGRVLERKLTCSMGRGDQKNIILWVMCILNDQIFRSFFSLILGVTEKL